MKTNVILFYIIAVFFFIAAAIYTWWTIAQPLASPIAGQVHPPGQPEWIGAVALTLSGAFGLFIAVYLTLTKRSVGGVLPEDREDANIDDGDPEVGFFAPWSWWPLVLGSAVGLIFLGLSVGLWIALIGIPLVLIAIIGWSFEHYRGNFAR